MESKLEANLHKVRQTLYERGWMPCLTTDSYDAIAACGFYAKNLLLAIVAAEILINERPMTLRGLFYRVVSAGWLLNTDREHYQALCRVMTTLREEGVVSFRWLVDGVRSTDKPNSWSGLQDFAETARDLYRKDFWGRLPQYVHVFCEKDAMAGALSPVTREYDVALSVVRGFSGVSYLHEIAEQWQRIQKPIYVYYLGDFDPSGLDLERDIKEKLARYSQREFSWQRLAVTPEDFAAFNLYPLQPKDKDSRTKAFLAKGYTHCAELDAIPTAELRGRLERAILSHISSEEWERLQRIEKFEREQWHSTLAAFQA
jgi:hypothetical protein